MRRRADARSDALHERPRASDGPRIGVRFIQSDRLARFAAEPVVSWSPVCSWQRFDERVVQDGLKWLPLVRRPGPMAASDGTDGLMARLPRGSSLWA